jgi:MFS family permease
VKRYRILIAAVVMQMCLGATYAWSVFVLPLKQLAGILQSTAQLPFSLFYFAFPATMMGTGTLLPRFGPRRCAMIGGFLFGGGWMLATFGRFHFGLTMVGIGLMAGVGVGFAYIVPIATCVRWFPRHKGLVTGVAVAGFGGGAALSGFNYGGILVLYASAAAEKWGAQRIGQVYGWLFSANIPAAVAPIVAGMVFDRLGHFAPVLWGIGVLMAVGALILGPGLRPGFQSDGDCKINQSVEGVQPETN